MQQKIIDAMVESGASAEDVAKSVVQLKLLEAIGEAPEKMAKELLGGIRNGDEITREKLEAILSGGGIGAEAAFRAALLQKVSHTTHFKYYISNKKCYNISSV